MKFNQILFILTTRERRLARQTSVINFLVSTDMKTRTRQLREQNVKWVLNYAFKIRHEADIISKRYFVNSSNGQMCVF